MQDRYDMIVSQTFTSYPTLWQVHTHIIYAVDMFQSSHPLLVSKCIPYP